MRIAVILIVLGLAFAAAGVALIFVGPGDASQPCTWGASSIVVDASGRVIAGPDVTGCMP
jgi:hypothetical protein